MSVPGKLLNQENIIKKVFDESLEALRVTGSISVTPAPGAATEAEQQAQTIVLESIDAKLDGPIDVNTTIVAPQVYRVTSIIDTSVTNISNVTYLTVEASTAEITKKIIAIDDIGEYMELFTGAPSSEVKLCALPLGGGEIEVNVPAGTRLSIKSLVSVISTGKIIFNLLK